MKFFISCDWGTSTFRLRLVNAASAAVIGEVTTHYGIAAAFEGWKQSGQPEEHRMAFYQTYLMEQVKKLRALFEKRFDHMTIVLSGMASSRIGMIELPYKEVPFQANGSDFIIHTIPQYDTGYTMVIISGACSPDDVLRGEETILAGVNLQNDGNEQLLIFPGTHSKHVTVKNNLVARFATYITGELFHLLSTKSILSASVKQNSDNGFNTRHFADGVTEGASSNLLNCLFHVRTNQLFDKATPEENYHFLSGLLIGNELKEVVKSSTASITLVSNEPLKSAYSSAFHVLGVSENIHYNDADEALIKGQLKVIRHFGSSGL